MLTECPECKRQVSDQAESCPQCGHPLKGPIQANPPTFEKARSAPIFLVLGVIGFALSFYTPRLLLFFPVLGTLVCGAISFFRREKGRTWAAAVMVLAIGLLILNQMTMPILNAGLSAANLDAAAIAGWNWHKDPNFGTHGAIKWNVEVQNKSTRNISSVRVEFTSYDKTGKLVTSTFAYVHAIPSGQTRSDQSFADLYGTEDRANVRIAEVTFAQ